MHLCVRCVCSAGVCVCVSHVCFLVCVSVLSFVCLFVYVWPYFLCPLCVSVFVFVCVMVCLFWVCPLEAAPMSLSMQEDCLCCLVFGVFVCVWTLDPGPLSPWLFCNRNVLEWNLHRER